MQRCFLHSSLLSALKSVSDFCLRFALFDALTNKQIRSAPFEHVEIDIFESLAGAKLRS